MNQNGATAGIIRIQVTSSRYDLSGLSVDEMLAPSSSDKLGKTSRMTERLECLVAADTRALKRELNDEYRLLVSQLPA
ncbi:MAG: hypothetical protein ACI9HK_004950 [Pirellulaceae bacterium]|jgi:hypothetical protein